MDLWQLIQSDLNVIRERHGRLMPFALSVFAAAVYRISFALRGVPGGRSVARVLTLVAVMVTGAEVDPQAQIGPGLYLDHTVGVVVGLGVVAGSNLTLYSGVVLGADENVGKYPVLGDGVTLYAKSSVIGAVNVGDGAIIGAHSLALSDIPAGATAVGTPARPTSG